MAEAGLWAFFGEDGPMWAYRENGDLRVGDIPGPSRAPTQMEVAQAQRMEPEPTAKELKRVMGVCGIDTKTGELLKVPEWES